MSRKKINTLAAALLVLIGYLYGHFQNSGENKNAPVAAPSLNQPTVLVTPPPVASPGASIKVIKVIDGDTIQLESGDKVRYIGIDTPETVDPRRGVGCFGREASDKNKELVLGKQVVLEKDISETDKYGRLLRYVYLENVSTTSGTSLLFVNDYLVKSGYAKASTYPPDVKHQKLFSDSEAYARENKLGLWLNCI